MPPRKSAATPDPSPPTRKRRWKRRLLITGLILLVLGALANGPGARWLIHRSIRSELTKLGMEGDLRVEGRLSSGFTFLDGNFASPDTQAAISFDELVLKYELLELLNKKIDIEKVHYRLLHPKHPPVDYHLGAITHPTNSDAFAVTGFHSNVLGEKGFPPQDLNLRWEHENLALDRLTIFPDLALTTAQVSYAPGSPVELFAIGTAF